MNIFKSFEKIRSEENIDEHERFNDHGEIMALAGADEETVAKILCVHGCSLPISKKIAKEQIEKLPEDYTDSNPPVSFVDVVKNTRDGMMSIPVDVINDYFKKYTNDEFKETVNRILSLREKGFKRVVGKLVYDLEPLVEGLILLNTALANEKNVIEKISEKERIELKIFGVWPAFVVYRRKKMEEADKRMLDKTEKLREWKKKTYG